MGRVARLAAVTIWALGATLLAAADWAQFRGPNASGVSADTGLPVEFGPQKNLVWRTPLPPGHSSPAVSGDRIYVTGWEGNKLYTICLERSSGKILWRREMERPRQERLHASNSPASPTPVSDGRNVWVFFTDFGLVSYGPDGEERWRMPLGPFINPMGQAASPVLAGNTLLMICDQEAGSFFLALDKDTGRVKWRVARPEYTRGFSTPVFYRPAGGALQVIIAGSYRLTAYEVESGKPVWWVRGLTWQLKPTPVMDENNIYVQTWAGESDPGQQEVIAPFADALSRMDSNGDGKLTRQELSDPKLQKGFGDLDLDNDNHLTERDWQFYQLKRAALNGIVAFRLGGQGDMTEKSFLWRYSKSLPNVPSPILYQGVLYMVKEGGIVTSLDPQTGAVLKQARLAGAPNLYFASPVAAEGKIYTISEEGKVSVLKAGPQWETLRVNEMGEDVHATPAIAGGRIYLRTHQALYCFARQGE